MDWYSSGTTASVMGALARGFNPRVSDLGLYLCGGCGKQSRRIPDELRIIAGRQRLDGETLVRSSRLTAWIGNNCIADGFQIHHHSFAVAASGDWAVVRQGTNTTAGYARRDRWHSAKVRDFVVARHTSVMGEPAGPIINLLDAQADRQRMRRCRFGLMVWQGRSRPCDFRLLFPNATG